MTWFLALRALPWKFIGLSALALAFVCLGVALKLERAHSAKLQTQLIACSQGRASDRASYEQAQKDAAIQNKAHVAQIEHQYQENSDAARRAYQSDLARLHALGVRQQGASATQSPAHGTGSSPVPAAPSGLDAAAQVCVSPADAMSSAETELRLFSLQSWISEQLKVKQ